MDPAVFLWYGQYSPIMIKIGSHNLLRPLRNTSVGVFLGDDEGTEVLLPNKYVPRHLNFDEKLNVFCYLDHEERPVATTLTPKIERGGFALLKVMDNTDNGAFLDWGLEKQLLVPFREQHMPMKAGESYLVHCFLDEKSFRLVASSRLEKFLSKDKPKYADNEKIALIAWRKSPLGWQVLVDGTFKGLLFENDIHRTIKTGDRFEGYIKHIRPDHKIDVVHQPMGKKSLDTVPKLILKALEGNNGLLLLHDKSTPEEIKAALGISKKAFKKGVGILYKQRKIAITENSILLNDFSSGK